MTSEGRDVSVSAALGRELAAATYPTTDLGAYAQARDEHGPWSREARGHLASQLRRAKAVAADDPLEASGLVDGVVAALEDRC